VIWMPEHLDIRMQGFESMFGMLLMTMEACVNYFEATMEKVNGDPWLPHLRIHYSRESAFYVEA
jgi:hypothetical protein